MYYRQAYPVIDIKSLLLLAECGACNLKYW